MELCDRHVVASADVMMPWRACALLEYKPKLLPTNVTLDAAVAPVFDITTLLMPASPMSYVITWDAVPSRMTTEATIL